MSFRIIHIEDNKLQSILTESILSKSLEDREDYVYQWVDSIQKAKSMLHDGCLNIIILDLGLHDNIETNPIEMIKNWCPKTPIIVLTGDDRIDTAKQCVRAGADAYLLKEHIRTLPLIVIMVVEKWELLQEQKRISDMYKSIVEESTDWIVRFTPQGEITFANASAIIGMGETSDSVIGKQIDNYLDNDQSVTHSDTISRLTPENPHIEGKDMWLNGHLIQWRKSGLYDAANNLIEIQAIGRDVTDHHFMMQRLLTDVKKMTQDTTNNANTLVDHAMDTMRKTLKRLEEEESYGGRN